MEQPLKWLEEHRLVAVIRSGSAEDTEAMIKAAAAGGIRIFEISMQTPQATRILEANSKKDGLLFGAGTVTDGEMAQRAINAGAKFLSSQYTDRDVINVAKNNDSFVIQGAFTPTEVMNAYQFGADLVQIFNAGYAGGPDYVRSLRAIFPFIKLAAAGGVTCDNALEYWKHTVAVSLRNAIFDKALVRSDNWSEITERARRLTQKLEGLKVAK